MEQEAASLAHLEALRTDTRDEIKRRIQQRDQYSMQLTVALGATLVGSFSANGTYRLFMLAPLVAIYFTALILYSYRIHDVLAKYLREQIEPEFSKRCGVPTDMEWETWYKASRLMIGIRRSFFVWEMWIVNLLSLVFVWYKEWSRGTTSCATLVVLGFATVLYVVLGLWTTSLLQRSV